MRFIIMNESGLLSYPNPANTTLYLDYDKPVEMYEIYNYLSCLVKSGKGNRIWMFLNCQWVCILEK